MSGEHSVLPDEGNSRQVESSGYFHTHLLPNIKGLRRVLMKPFRNIPSTELASSATLARSLWERDPRQWQLTVPLETISPLISACFSGGG